MSTQHPTRSGFSRSAPLFVIVLGLGALVWSCESEQTGYDVSIPLLGPTEFQQTSCEDSGDLCTSDDECFDEGFDVGPCTKTMKEIAAITVPVSLSPSNPSYTLGAPDTGGWSTLFLALDFADGDLPEGARIVMTMDDFSLGGAPVTIGVRIFSRIGVIAGRPPSYQPVAPSTCTFTLDDTSTGQDYADGINTCLSDWVADNGAPVDFDMEVSASFGPAASSGSAQKQIQQEEILGVFGMEPESPCFFQEEDEVLDAVREGDDFLGPLDCGGLAATGTAITEQELEIFAGGAAVNDVCSGTGIKGFFGAGPLAMGTYEITVESGTDPSAPSEALPLVFVPDDVDFADTLFRAAQCESATAFAGWVYCDDSPTPPTGSLEVSAAGFCPLSEGSDGAGATEGSGL